MASIVTEEWNIDFAGTSGSLSQELMNSLMSRGGDQEEARVLKGRNMDPERNPMAYTVMSFDNVVSNKWFDHNQTMW